MQTMQHNECKKEDSYICETCIANIYTVIKCIHLNSVSAFSYSSNSRIEELHLPNQGQDRQRATGII